MMSVFLMCVVLTCSVSAQTHNGTGNESRDTINSIASTAGYTVTDSQGNKFRITGSCGVGSSKAMTYTYFNTTHYVGGTVAAKNKLDGKTKTLKASGVVAMQHGLNGASTSYSGTSYMTGASNSYTSYSDTLLYPVIDIQGSHYFSCNGGSGSGASSCSYY